MHSLRLIGLTLLALVLLPVAVYVAVETRSLSENEALMEGIYERQLEQLLFTVNQHAWDVADGWASELSRSLKAVHETPAAGPADEHEAAALAEFRATKPGVIRAVLTADSTLQSIRVSAAPEQDVAEVLLEKLDARTVERLRQRYRAGYRQLEPVLLDDGNDPAIALVFAVDVPGAAVHVGALVIHTQMFVTDVLAPKLQDVSREQFLIGLFRRGAADPLYATGPFRLDETEQTRVVWLFPDYVLGIRPRDASIQDVVQARFRRNLVLVLLMACVLLAGVGVVYRSIHREVDLARMKADFVSNVSHELRTPLALIRMYAETLELGRVRSDAMRHEYYRIISQETERLTRLVNNILNFSRIEAGKKTYDLQPLALNAVVEDVLSLYHHTLEADGFATEVILDDDLPPIRGDREALTEALINLVDNAAKYSGGDKYLRVQTQRHGESVFLDVVDHGVGIPRAEQSKIFDKFYRISEGLVHNTKGTGLGLALVKHIVDAHEGVITVDSAPGRGSTFRLVFPIAEPTPNVVPALAAS